MQAVLKVWGADALRLLPERVGMDMSGVGVAGPKPSAQAPGMETWWKALVPPHWQK